MNILRLKDKECYLNCDFWNYFDCRDFSSRKNTIFATLTYLSNLKTKND